MQEESRDEPGSEVQSEVDGSGCDSRLQAAAELFSCIFQAEHKQQQQDADFGTNPGELLAYMQGCEAAFPKGEPGQKVEWNRGDAIAFRKSRQNCETGDDESQFNEERQKCPLFSGIK
jgi:hypothetical protein